MEKFNPDRRPNPKADAARRKAHLAIVALKKFMGPASVAVWLREYADNLAHLDIAHTKIDGILGRHEREKSPRQRAVEERIRRKMRGED